MREDFTFSPCSDHLCIKRCIHASSPPPPPTYTHPVSYEMFRHYWHQGQGILYFILNLVLLTVSPLRTLGPKDDWDATPLQTLDHRMLEASPLQPCYRHLSFKEDQEFICAPVPPFAITTLPVCRILSHPWEADRSLHWLYKDPRHLIG